MVDPRLWFRGVVNCVFYRSCAGDYYTMINEEFMDFIIDDSMTIIDQSRLSVFRLFLRLKNDY